MKSKPVQTPLRAEVVLFLVFILTACSVLPWLNSETRTSRKINERALADEEVVIIDGEEYVKIMAQGKGGKSSGMQVRYIPVDEYLSKREEFSAPQGPGAAEEEEEESEFQGAEENTSQPEELAIGISREEGKTPLSPSMELKRKIVIARFDGGRPEEPWGEMVAERLRHSLENRTEGVLCLDDHILVDYLKGRGIESVSLDNPMVVRIANTVFGVHALLYGSLSGPYVTASKAGEQVEKDTALAIVRIQAKLVETATDRVMKSFEERNSIFATEEKGTFSRDKAKLKAIHLALEKLTKDILSEINQMVWYTRIVKVDGDRVYLNAGRLTGLKIGDLMDVYGPGEGNSGQVAGVSTDPLKDQRKGQVRVSQLFGTDAAMADIISGRNFGVSDVVRASMH
jgi:hypothetical protein